MRTAGLILLLALGGCSLQPSDTKPVGLAQVAAQLRQENWRLKYELHQLQTGRDDDLGYYERQAGLAQACDWFVPTCPESVVRLGRKALAQGYGGGYSGSFWLIFIMKLAVLGSALGSAWCVAALWWVKRGRPAEEEVQRARELVDGAEAQAQAAYDKLQEYRRLGEHARESQEVAVERLRRLERQANAAGAKLTKLKAAVTEQEATLKAIRGE